MFKATGVDDTQTPGNFGTWIAWGMVKYIYIHEMKGFDVTFYLEYTVTMSVFLVVFFRCHRVFVWPLENNAKGFKRRLYNKPKKRPKTKKDWPIFTIPTLPCTWLVCCQRHPR